MSADFIGTILLAGLLLVGIAIACWLRDDNF